MQPKLLPEVQSFINQQPIAMFIGGRWENSNYTFEVNDPGTGKLLAHVAEARAKEIDHAVNAATNAFYKTKWATLPATERADYLQKLANLIDKHKNILTQLEALDVGKTLTMAESDVTAAAQTLRYFAELVTTVDLKQKLAIPQFDVHTVLQPYGACAFIIPWNFPFLLTIWAIAPALAAGNTVIVKPAENTPLSTLYLGKLATEAGFPAGVINVVPGFGSVAGAALANHAGIKRMSFTGSPEVGKLVATATGANLVLTKLELGGKGAAIVLEDVDIDATAKKLSDIITCNTGQMCCTASRWLVSEKIYNQFTDKLLKLLPQTAIGYAFDPNTYMGPVVSETQRQRILSLIKQGEQTGATSLLKVKSLAVEGYEQGYYLTPGLLTGSYDNICAQKEIFGPVAFIIPFKTEQEAIEIVHSSTYGLGNSVWSNDVAKATRMAESLVAGINWINTHNAVPLGVPYAGYNLSGFGGGVNSLQTLLDYYRLVSIVKPQ